MRQMLADRTRRKLADMRGAGLVPESLEAGMADPAELIAPDDAFAARAAAVVELRVFAGLTIDEGHENQASSVNREWARANVWLKTDVFAQLS